MITHMGRALQLEPIMCYSCKRTNIERKFSLLTNLSIEIYSDSCVGGNLHIVLDDGNVSKNDLDFCAKLDLSDNERKFLDLFGMLTEQQRIIWWYTKNVDDAITFAHGKIHEDENCNRTITIDGKVWRSEF